MKINIYYGGRGMMDDPTLYVLKKIESTLSDLFVETKRYNIYERKNEISTLPQTFKDVDGIILATTVEWLGIGGYMTQFLDACWLFGDKERIKNIYMQPIVISTTYGEREGVLALENAWEILGGIPCSGLCGFVEDMAAFEENVEYEKVIVKKVENLYRIISQKTKGLPASNQAVTQRILRKQTLPLTQQENDQLSAYVADDEFVNQQKQDIVELSALYRNMMGEEIEDESTEFISSFKAHFRPEAGYQAVYCFDIEEKQKPLIVSVNENEIDCFYGEAKEDILMKLSIHTMEKIVTGQLTFGGAFSMGEMKVRGHQSKLQKLDAIFVFS